MNNRRLAGFFIAVWAAIFAHLETNLFGYNWLPKTMAELICDAIALGVGFYGWYLLLTKKP